MLKRELKATIEKDPSTVSVRGNHVLIKRAVEEEKTKGGIFIPKDIRKPVSHAILIQAGSDASEEVRSISPGTRVIVHGHAMVQMRFGWENDIYDIIVDEDIVASVGG